MPRPSTIWPTIFAGAELHFSDYGPATAIEADFLARIEGPGRAPANSGHQRPANGGKQRPANGANQRLANGANQCPANGANQCPANGANQ
jgi:hypothetical protein